MMTGTSESRYEAKYLNPNCLSMFEMENGFPRSYQDESLIEKKDYSYTLKYISRHSCNELPMTTIPIEDTMKIQKSCLADDVNMRTEQEDHPMDQFKNRAAQDHDIKLRRVQSEFTLLKANINGDAQNTSEEVKSQLDAIFNIKLMPISNLSERKDVVNKIVLRAFKKFFVGIFEDVQKRNKDRIINHDKQQKVTLVKAKEVGIINNWNPESQEYIDLVYWMSVAKITKSVKDQY